MIIKPTVKVTVKGQDKVDDLRRRLGVAAGSYVTIGVHDGAGSYGGANPPSVVEVALWNEFGTRKVPERSYIRSAIDENMGRIYAYRDDMIDNILFKGWAIEKALSSLGLFIQTLIQNKIKSNVPPEYGTGMGGNIPDRVSKLQAAKRRRVGHTNTLRDTELLLRSITFKVVIVK